MLEDCVIELSRQHMANYKATEVLAGPSIANTVNKFVMFQEDTS